MKRKLLLSVSIILMTLMGNAQFKKGSVLLGGDVGFSTQKTTQGTTNSMSNNFSFSPTVGFATKTNLFQGIQLLFSSTNNKYGSNNINKSNAYGGAYFIRKYKSILGKFHGFLQASIGANYSKGEENGIINYDINTFSTQFSLSPGINFSIAKNVYLETGFSNIASLSYQKSKRTSTSVTTSTTQSFGFSSNLSAAGNGLYFGFRIMLAK